MRATATFLLVIGCTGDKDTTETGETAETGAPTTDTSDTQVPTETGTDPQATASLTGEVTGPSGPVIDAQLRLCRGALCRNGATGTDGSFSFENLPEEWHSFEVIPLEGAGLATVFLPIVFAEDEARTLSLTALPHDAPSALGPSPEEHTVGTGLYLTVAEGELEPPLFQDPATEVFGVRVPQEYWVPTDGVQGTVLAQWYVGPFDHHALPAGGLPIRIDDEWGTAEGADNFRVYVGSYIESAWVDAGQATHSGGSFTGAALPLLSTVILVQE
jgi:hypothetical protein